MKPIRIILINNLTTALFMAAYYSQENKRSDNYRDVCLIHWYGIKDNNTDQERITNNLYIEACKQVAQKISTEIIVCPGRITENVVSSFISVYRETPNRLYYLNAVNAIFKQNKINPEMIVEVYHGNGSLHQYIKYLSPKTKLIGFEHGIHEISCYLNRLDMLFSVKNMIKTILGRMFLIFYPYSENDDLLVSLFASRVKNFNRHIRIEEVTTENVNRIADIIAREDIVDKNLLNNYRNAGIILLADTYDLTDNEKEYFNFSKSFLDFISGRIKKKMPQISTIIFKPRHYSKHFNKIKTMCRDYFKGYSVFFFDEISRTHLPFEYYLNIMQPKALFGDMSSGLFYSKILAPAVETHSFYKFVDGYLSGSFMSQRRVFKLISDTFYFRHRKIFNDILPAEM